MLPPHPAVTSQLQGGEEQVGGEEGGSLVLRLNFLHYTVLKKNRVWTLSTAPWQSVIVVVNCKLITLSIQAMTPRNLQAGCL